MFFNYSIREAKQNCSKIERRLCKIYPPPPTRFLPTITTTAPEIFALRINELLNKRDMPQKRCTSMFNNREANEKRTNVDGTLTQRNWAILNCIVCIYAVAPRPGIESSIERWITTVVADIFQKNLLRSSSLIRIKGGRVWKVRDVIVRMDDVLL